MYKTFGGIKMKKGLCIVLSALMLLVSFAACGKKDIDETNQTTKLNANGEAYINVTNKNGEDMTDTDGQTVTSVLSDKDKSKLDKTNKDDKTDKNDGTTTTTTTKPTGTAPSVPFEDILGGEDFNINASPDDLLEEGTTVAKKTTLREDVIGNSLQKRKFTLSTVMVGESGEIPVTFTMNGDEFASSIKMPGMPMKVIVQDGKTYICFEYMGVKLYMESEESMFDAESMTPSTEAQEYVGTSTVKEGDKTYTCEEYKAESGATYKYYFLGKKWVRYEAINGDEAAILEVTEFKNTVDKDLFSLKGYKKFNTDSLSGLGNLGL